MKRTSSILGRREVVTLGTVAEDAGPRESRRLDAVRRFVPSSPETIAAARAYAERELTDDEAAAYLATPMTEDERAEILAQHDWFVRRYPTVAERFAWARRQQANIRALQRAAGVASGGGRGG